MWKGDDSESKIYKNYKGFKRGYRRNSRWRRIDFLDKPKQLKKLEKEIKLDIQKKK